MKKTMKLRTTVIIWSIVIAFVLALTVVVNALSLTMFDNLFTQFFGATESKVDTSNVPDEIKDLDLEYVKSDYDSVEDFRKAERDFCEEVAEEGIMLLKNDGALPLSTASPVDVWGWQSYNFIYSGTGSGGNGTSGAQQNLKDGLTQAGITVNDTLWNYYATSNYSTKGYWGLDHTANKHTVYGLQLTYGKGGTGLGSCDYAGNLDWTIFEIPYSVVSSNGSVMASTNNSVAVYSMGRIGGETADLPRYMKDWTTENSLDREADGLRHYLQPNSLELDMLAKLKQKYSKLVVLLNTNNAMEIGEIEKYADAIVWCPSMGSRGTCGLGNLLAGKTNFSGRLPDTLVNDARSTPAQQNMGDFTYTNSNSKTYTYHYVTYLEGIYVGHKYYETRYEDCVLKEGNASKADVYNTDGFDYSKLVGYPFGHGLSYTTFEWSGFHASEPDKSGNITVDVTVKNTGSTAGREVVQVYARAPYIKGGVEKAAAELVGFAKTKELAPQAEDTVHITFKRSDLKSYDYKNKKTYILDAGDYYVTAAKNVHAAVNNMLAARGKTTADGMTENGNADLVKKYTFGAETFDKDTATGTAVTNHMDHADCGFTYLSRNDWSGTYPKPNGVKTAPDGAAGIAVNNSYFGDYTYTSKAPDEVITALASTSSRNPDNDDGSAITDKIMDGGGTSELQLIDMRGKPFDDPHWKEVLDKLTLNELQTLVTLSGFQTTKMDSVNKPATVEHDGPSGWSSVVNGTTGIGSEIVYPSEQIFAASFDTELAERYGVIMGVSALYFGQNGWYAPGMNIHRTYFGGRNYEYYSEDAFLTGAIGSHVVHGASSKGLYTFMKHFALNEQDEFRAAKPSGYGLVTWCNEQAIREIYLKPFEMAVKTDTVTVNYYELQSDGTYKAASAQMPGCMGVMTSFNRIGPVWAGGDYNLLTKILREEWGFDGFVITDYKESRYMYPQQMCYAGGDAELNNVNISAQFRPGASSANYRYARAAAHRVLFTVANSAAMNGFIHGAVFIPGFAYYKLILIAEGVVAAAVVGLGVFFIVRKVKKTKAAAAAV